MIPMKYNKIGTVLMAFAATLALSSQAIARPDVNATKRTTSGLKRGQLKTTASCKPAEASIDLDINNVRARLMTGGDMWWDNGTGEARYEIPKGSRKNSLFAGSVWIGGKDENGVLKVAAQTYRQSGNDYWPGPLDANTAEITEADCSEWDRFWKINKETINKFKELADPSSVATDAEFEAIYQWPAKGNVNAVGRNQGRLNLDNGNDYAPFIDVDNNGIYDATAGDYPGDPSIGEIPGDQYIWWVFNDKGNTKQQSNTAGIGIEVQASAFAYSTKDFLNDATFYNYRLINRGGLSLDSTYISTWTDADLGYYSDDYIGCDTTRGLGILYNGTSFDGTGAVNSYADKIPMVGVDFFKGPTKVTTVNGITTTEILGMEAFTYYNNDNSVIGNPNNGNEIYNYMTGSIRNGQRFSNDFKGANTLSKGYGEGPVTPYVFFGDPGVRGEWSECTCNNPVGDRRFVHSAGAFKLLPGVVNDITIGVVWVSDVGGCPNTSFRKIRVADDLAQQLFDNNFQTIEGPEAPRMEVRALDRKLVFYITNDPISNNYQELYGTGTEDKYRVASTKAARYVKSPDSLYVFEGYRVFQVRDRFVTPAQIFNDDGVLNEQLAVEVFQVDKQNGISKIINYDRKTDISDTTFVPVVKVDGNDSGIKHSFEVTSDLFATGDNKRLVNYKNYYFVAIAYAYNNFADFDAKHSDSTQDILYLESAKGAGGSPIPVVVGTPDPSNGDMGNVLNADFGDGVVIKRIEGRGNGGNALFLSDSSENEAVYGTPTANGTVNQSIYPTYVAGKGPVKVKVVDPVKLQPYDFELAIKGPLKNSKTGVISDSATWTLTNITTGATIMSERIIGFENEQVLEDYGFSVDVKQAVLPSEDQGANRNGIAYDDIIFSDPSNPWLAGVNDAEARAYTNWIRSGNTNDTSTICDWNDMPRGKDRYDSVGQYYEKLLSKFSTTTGTWAPYALASDDNGTACGFGVTKKPNNRVLTALPSVDVVITSDKSKWTRCAVVELCQDSLLSEGGAGKFQLRRHAGWNGDLDANGRPVYSPAAADSGMSFFPGYAINQETGERLNMYFGEDSYLKNHNGDDMIWNPTSTAIEPGLLGSTNVIFGGKHIIYVENTRYDSGKVFVNKARGGGYPATTIYDDFVWVGVPLLNGQSKAQFKPLSEGQIPNDVRIQLKIRRPYTTYNTAEISGGTLRNDGYPLYYFTTKGLAPTKLADNQDVDKQTLLDRIHAVPNPYYGYTGYEQNRYDTKMKVINLPARASISIYSLDGTLIRRIEKDNANVAYIDWDIRNAKGLPIASGMYLIHVNAEGIGEKVIRWFGAMRPIDITNY